jgi:hypothetical protein
MKKFTFLQIFSFVFLLSACGVQTEDQKTALVLGEPADTPLEGKIETTNWTMQSGLFRQHLSNPNLYSFRLYESAPTGNVCNYAPPQGERIVAFDIPKGPGTYELGPAPQPSVSFLKTGANWGSIVATNGSIVLQSVNQTTAIGKLNAAFDENSIANGRFGVTYCP